MMESKIAELKSILKNPSGKAPAEDPREVALRHARLIQQRKEIEAEILDSLILLSEYPSERGPSYSAESPAPSDVDDFKKHVRLFQPSDYDDLIEERNVNGLCGYTLCAKPRRQTGSTGEWKIMANGDIVKRADVEKWCSKLCSRRGLFVKVQLNETAAWERAGVPDITIDLLEEDRSQESDADQTARKLRELSLEDQRQALRQSAALAIERGQPSTTAKDKIRIQLKEKETQAPKEDMQPPDEEDHLLVEGYPSKQ